MEEQKNNKKLIIIAGILLILLFGLIAIYFSLGNSSSESFQSNEESKSAFFGLFGGTSNEKGSEGQWYVGYMNKRTQSMSYSQLFFTEKECLEYEAKVKETPSLEVVIGCFEVPVGVDGPQGEDVFTTDVFVQQEDGSSQISTIKNQDTAPPIITILGKNPAQVSIGGTYVDAGATANDNIDGNISAKITVNGLPVVTFRKSKITITYRVTDSAGNIGYATREVQVVEGDVKTIEPDKNVKPLKNQNIPKTIWGDNEDPIIVLKGYNPVQLEIGEAYYDAGAAAYDFEDGDISASVKIAGLPVNTQIAGDYYVTYKVTDRNGNIAKATRVIQVSDFEIDMTSDMSYMTSCFGKMARGLCKKTDINQNGAVGTSDADMLVDILFPFEVSGDPMINLSTEGTITSCFLKINGQCAFEEYGNLEVTSAYLADVAGNALYASVANGYEHGIDLGRLGSNLSSSPVDRIVYGTFSQYDINKDGIADLNGWVGGDGINNKDKEIFDSCVTKDAVGSCAAADINGDGSVQLWDLIMFTAMQSNLLPETFTIKEFDQSMFDRTLYSDALIVSYCIENNLTQGVCEFVDFNQDSQVNDLDKTLFYDTVSQYDFNGDGKIDGISLSF